MTSIVHIIEGVIAQVSLHVLAQAQGHILMFLPGFVCSVGFQDIQAAVFTNMLLSTAPACACHAEACCKAACVISTTETWAQNDA